MWEQVFKFHESTFSPLHTILSARLNSICRSVLVRVSSFLKKSTNFQVVCISCSIFRTLKFFLTLNLITNGWKQWGIMGGSQVTPESQWSCLIWMPGCWYSYHSLSSCSGRRERNCWLSNYFLDDDSHVDLWTSLRSPLFSSSITPCRSPGLSRNVPSYQFLP